MKHKVVCYSFGLLASTLVCCVAAAQDTLRLTVPGAEALFLKNNLSLVAAQYGIAANEALVKQAGLWDNPTLSSEQNLYDGKFLRHGKSSPAIPNSGGELYLSLQQLIRTAGKRGLQVQLATDATATARAQLDEVLRNLRYLLTVNLNNLAALQSGAVVLQTQIVHVQRLAAGMDELLKVGDIALKDNVRIKALLYSLQSEYANNLSQQQDLQRDIRTITGTDQSTPIAVTLPSFAPAQLQGLTVAALIDSATLRSDLAIARNQVFYQQHNLSYQKALAKPDLTIGVDYDKANSYVSNYVGLQLALPLPVFNKNRGNITAAGWAVQAAQKTLQQNVAAVRNDVLSAYNKIQTLLKVQKSAGAWTADYEMLLRNMIESYTLRKVSLIDFVDFFSSYKDTRSAQLQQQTALLNAIAELNFASGKTIIPLN